MASLERQSNRGLEHSGNDDAEDWSTETNGLRHDHVTSEIMEYLVECALIVGPQRHINSLHVHDAFDYEDRHGAFIVGRLQIRNAILHPRINAVKGLVKH
jgi:hypothetical protein